MDILEYGTSMSPEQFRAELQARRRNEVEEAKVRSKTEEMVSAILAGDLGWHGSFKEGTFPDLTSIHNTVYLPFRGTVPEWKMRKVLSVVIEAEYDLLLGRMRCEERGKRYETAELRYRKAADEAAGQQEGGGLAGLLRSRAGSAEYKAGRASEKLLS